MTTKLTFSLLAVSFLAIAPALAQSSNAQEEDKSAKTRSVTGCLSPGDSANEFKLTQDDGSTWEIQSKAVKLSPHVGHTVTITGKVWHPDMHGAKEKAKDTVDSSAKEHGHLNATNVTMVSESCKK
jgi:hypothetical protein